MHTDWPSAIVKNLVRCEMWSRTCVFRTTLLLPSTAIRAIWNLECCCCQQKNKRPQPASGKYRFTDSGLRFTPKMGWQLCIMHEKLFALFRWIVFCLFLLYSLYDFYMLRFSYYLYCFSCLGLIINLCYLCLKFFCS